MAPKKLKKTEPAAEEDVGSVKGVQPAQRVLNVDMTESMRDEVLAIVGDVFKKGLVSLVLVFIAMYNVSPILGILARRRWPTRSSRS
jgi:hypothetical protein